MKKIKFLAFILVSFMFVGLVNVNAEEDHLTKIGDNYYDSLQAAVNASASGDVIEILKDASNVPGFIGQAGRDLTIDFKGHTITMGLPLVGSTGTETQNFQLLKGSTYVFKNGTIKAASTAKMLIQNYSNLTLEDMTIDITTSSVGMYALSSNCGEVNIIGNTSILSNDRAFDMCWAPNKNYPEGTQIVVDTTGTIKGTIELDIWGGLSTTVTDIASTLVIKNINHIGDFSIDNDLKDQLTIENGSFSEEVENLTLPEGTKQYKVLGIDEDKYVVVSDEDLTYDVVVEEMEKDDLDAEELKLITDASKKLQVVAYYNLDLTKITENDEILEYVTTVDNKVKVTLNIPTTLEKVKDGFTRKYYIVRVHDGETTIIPAKDNSNGTISFESDKFSTYALTYEDSVIENPKTGDMNLFLIIVSIIVGGAGLIATKRKMIKNY